jgi:hypothetical protein
LSYLGRIITGLFAAVSAHPIENVRYFIKYSMILKSLKYFWLVAIVLPSISDIFDKLAKFSVFSKQNLYVFIPHPKPIIVFFVAD